MNRAFLALLFALELVGLAMARQPTCLRLEGFASGDWGANLTAPDLVEAGLRPSLDFNYPYGLLALTLGNTWLAWTGNTPQRYFEAMLICHALIAIGLARFLVARRAGWVGVALVAVLMPYVVPPTFSNFAHAFETLFLVQALAAHAEGRRRETLIWIVLAAFAKPSMAYCYGILFTILMAWELRRQAWRPMVPGFLLAMVLALAMAAIYGPEPVLRTQIPANAAASYEANDFGFFFGSGRNYWLPAHATIGHYVGTQRGWWVLATLLLMIGGAIELGRVLAGTFENGESRLGAEVLVVIAGLHLAFLCLFFANEFSWVYYGFLPVLGVAAMALATRWGQVLVWGMVALGLVSVRGVPGEVRSQWAKLRPAEQVGGLWTTPEAAREWEEARAVWRQGEACLLSWAGHSWVVGPELATDVRYFVMPGMEENPDALRMGQLVAASEFVVVPTAKSQSFRDFLVLQCPPTRDAMKGTTLVYSGEYVEVYRRGSGVNPNVPASENQATP